MVGRCEDKAMGPVTPIIERFDLKDLDNKLVTTLREMCLDYRHHSMILRVVFDGLKNLLPPRDSATEKVYILLETIINAIDKDLPTSLIEIESMIKFRNIKSIVDELEFYSALAQEKMEHLDKIWQEIGEETGLWKLLPHVKSPENHQIVRKEFFKRFKQLPPLRWVTGPARFLELSQEVIKDYGIGVSISLWRDVFYNLLKAIREQFPPIIKELKQLTKTKTLTPKPKPKDITILNMPEGTKPGDITFEFKGHEIIDVFVFKERDTLFRCNVSREDLGFYLGPKAKNLNVLWELLIVMSVNYYDPQWAWTPDKSAKYRKQSSNLNIHLKELFKIKDNIITLKPELNGYRPTIVLNPPPPEQRHASVVSRE